MSRSWRRNNMVHFRCNFADEVSMWNRSHPRLEKLLYLLLACAVPGFAELPDSYKHFDRLFCVVDHNDRSSAGWQMFGAIVSASRTEYETTVEYRGKSRKARLGWSSVPFAGITADFIEPLTG